MKKRLCIAGIVLALLALPGIGVGLFVQTREPDPIQYQNWNRVRLGMAMREVEDLLGCPPGVYITGPVEKFVPTIGRAGVPPKVDKWCVWDGNQMTISLGFDAGGRVVDHYFLDRPQVDFWESIKKRLGLRYRTTASK